MISPHYVEVESEDDIVRVQRVLWAAGFAFIQGKTTYESLEQCERRVSPETADKPL